MGLRSEVCSVVAKLISGNPGAAGFSFAGVAGAGVAAWTCAAMASAFQALDSMVRHLFAVEDTAATRRAAARAYARLAVEVYPYHRELSTRAADEAARDGERGLLASDLLPRLRRLLNPDVDG